MLEPVFQVVVAGCTGGPCENNLSGYLLSPFDLNEWIVLDAGSLLGGIDAALAKNNFPGLTFNDFELLPSAEMLVKHLRCYLISHAHLDHIAGMVINSQNDTHKYILGIKSTIDNIRDHIFNGLIWPNYGNEGVDPIIGRYTYMRLPLHKLMAIPNTTMNVETYLLSHPHGYPSTAFLIEYKGHYILYFGDTSSDLLETEKHLARIWRRVAPVIKNKKLKGMLLECSVSENEKEQVIYGHLDTRLMMQELHNLAEISEASLEGFKVMVTHRKETLKKGQDVKEMIKEELMKMNDLGVDFLFPNQGDRFLF